MSQFDKRNEYLYLNLINKKTHIFLTQFGRTLPVKEYCEKKREVIRFLFDYVISGRGYVLYNDRRYEVQAGDMIFIRKGAEVEYGTDPVDLYRKLWFAVDGTAVEAMAESYLDGRAVVIRRNGDIELFLKMKSIVTSVGSDERLVSHALLDIFMELAELPEADKSGDDSRNLGPRIKNYIDSRVTERFSLDGMVDYFHVSKRHIIRVFKEDYGITPGAYHNKQRLCAAAHYMTETAYTVGEIASLLGYCDQSFFSTAFKKRFGVYPLAYRAGNYSSTISPSPNE